MTQCKGITKERKQCTRQVSDGSYCYQHKPDDICKTPVKIKTASSLSVSPSPRPSSAASSAYSSPAPAAAAACTSVSRTPGSVLSAASTPNRDQRSSGQELVVKKKPQPTSVSDLVGGKAVPLVSDRKVCKGMVMSTGDDCTQWADPDSDYCKVHQDQKYFRKVIVPLPPQFSFLKNKLVLPVGTYEVQNVVGSSIHHGNWIAFYRNATGDDPARCLLKDCGANAEVGGHMWVKGYPKRNFYYILPICKSHNSDHKINDGGKWIPTKGRIKLVVLTMHPGVPASKYAEELDD